MTCWENKEMSLLWGLLLFAGVQLLIEPKERISTGLLNNIEMSPLVDTIDCDVAVFSYGTQNTF